MDLPDCAIAADTITKLPPDTRGRTLVSGSHGGVYPGWLAAAAGARSVILCDAGVGKDDAGVAGLKLCGDLGMAAAAVDARTCRIGDTADMLTRGRISRVNAVAEGVGVRIGQACRAAVNALAAAPAWTAALPSRPGDGRREMPLDGSQRLLVLVDSASLVEAADAGEIVVTGSHGALVGGDAAMALRTDAYAAFFNDAGGGPDGWGTSRLPALDARGIAAATVGTMSARIGDARSTYADGRLSAVNDVAAERGLAVGQSCRDAVARLAT